MNNIDKDIEIVESRLNTLNKHITNYERIDCKTEIYQNLVREKQATENILNRLKEYDSKIIHLSDEEYRKVIDNAQSDLKLELAIKDKMIDELIDELTCDEWDNCCSNCTHECEKDYDQLSCCIKEHFRKEAEKNVKKM